MNTKSIRFLTQIQPQKNIDRFHLGRLSRGEGPHAGSELELMLQGRKPAAFIGETSKYEKFLPYIKQRRFVSKKDPTGGWIISQPDETWRIDKIIKLFSTPIKQKMGPRSHAMLGLLFGYSKDDIRKFIQSQKKT